MGGYTSMAGFPTQNFSRFWISFFGIFPIIPLFYRLWHTVFRTVYLYIRTVFSKTSMYCIPQLMVLYVVSTEKTCHLLCLWCVLFQKTCFCTSATFKRLTSELSEHSFCIKIRIFGFFRIWNAGYVPIYVHVKCVKNAHINNHTKGKHLTHW